MKDIKKIGIDAKNASFSLATLPTYKKNAALLSIASAIIENIPYILKENEIDIKNAKENGIKESLIDRLMLNENRLKGIAEGVRQVAELNDPIGEVINMTKRPNGLLIGKMRVPLGVIAIIYESRPNVTVDAAVLTLKSGNAVILRGGKEAINSNIALVKIMTDTLEKEGLDRNYIQIIKDTSRETATELMRLNGYVDVLIPRGGTNLIKSVVKNATVSVIETGAGNCHVYIDNPCDLEMAIEILYNSKTQRPSVCNAAETLLVHKDVAQTFLPMAKKRLEEKNVEIRGCSKTQSIIECLPVSEEDYDTEYLDLILSVKVVENINEAINHINKHGTKHSEVIVTKDYFHSQEFLNKVDAAAVYVNASSRFTDGNEFGLGAEIGISTQKMHARGPMGLNELTTVKYIIYGEGQVRG